MCGIFGYVGESHDVAATVGPALRSLEYRGYDSWGIAWDGGNRLRAVKRTGRVPGTLPFAADSRIAIGHTRWATHGGVTNENAHPHIDCTGRIAIVHNGIVENAIELRSQLGPLHRISSETDSEIVAHMLEERLAGGSTILSALIEVFPRLEGQNAVIALDHQACEIAAVMNVSPLLIGHGDRGVYIASDPFALWPTCTSMMVIPDGRYVMLRGSSLEIFDDAEHRISAPSQQPVPAPDMDLLAGFDHYMAKELAEEPGNLKRQAVQNAQRLEVVELLRGSRSVVLTGCGSALIAARLGATLFTELGGIPALAAAASEFDDILPFVDSDTTVVCLSQSGETADLLAALRTAKARNARSIGLVNVMHSSAARAVDIAVPLGSGRERSVLATKSFTAMLGELVAIAGELRGFPDAVLDDIQAAAVAMDVLSEDSAFRQAVDRISAYLARHTSVLSIGRGKSLPIAQEAALKFKEASYVHAEAFPAGELKHGAIALVEQGVPCLLFFTSSAHRELASCASELNSRAGYTIGIGHNATSLTCDGINLPDVGHGMPLLQAFVVHHIGYRLAIHKGLDPDYPRNLAKSVTVK